MLEPLTLRLQAWLRHNGVATAPPPARVGVFMGGRDLRVARVLAGGGGRPRLEFAEVMPCEPAGRSAALRRAAQAGAFRFAAVHLVLAPGSYETHLLPAPAVPDDELRDAVRFQLRGALAYPIEQAVVDSVRIPQPAGGGGRATLLVVSARAGIVLEAARAFEQAGVDLDTVEVPEFAQRNLGALYAAAEGTHAWLSVDGDACLLTVQLGDELAFARHFQLPSVQAPSAPSEIVDLDAEAAQPGWHERIANQVLRSLDLFERQSGLPPVLQLTIAPHPQAASIARALAELTGIQADVFDAAAAFELMPALDSGTRTRAERLAACIPALGAALRSDAPARARSTLRPKQSARAEAQPA
jgi:MSHA biogenesis protein MshI